VHFDELPGNRQPQACARRCQDEWILAAEESLKDAVLLAGCDANPLSVTSTWISIARGDLYIDGYDAILGRIVVRVVQ